MKSGKHRNGNGNRKQSAIGNGQSADVTAYAANRLNQYSLISNHVNHGISPRRSEAVGNPVQISPTYDLNGNMTWDGTNAYFWDVQNQLVLVSNSYDAMGRRVRKEVSRRDAETQSWSVESTRHFFYDGWNLVAEIGSRSSEVSTNRYVWGNDLSGTLQGAGGVGGLLAVSTLPTAYCQLPIVSYPLYDHNGNVERYVSRSGATVASYQYDAFGNTVSETVNGEPGTLNLPFRFSTKYWDAEVGLYNYGYRFYYPTRGKWLSRDPLEVNNVLINNPLRFLFSRNKQNRQIRKVVNNNRTYLFVENMPVNATDYLGLDRQIIIFLHMWIRLDVYDDCCRKTGQVDLHFAPAGDVDYLIEPLDSTGYPTRLHYTIKSGCEEDRRLLDLWKHMQALGANGPQWSPLYNCWSSSLQFANYGVFPAQEPQGYPFPPPPIYGPESPPPWGGGNQNRPPDAVFQ